jgi:hypothetical protein
MAGGRPDARRWYEEGLRQLPDSGLLAFSFGQELERGGDWAGALRAFDRARFGLTPERERLGLAPVPAQYSVAIARYCYLWGSFAEAQQHLQPLIDLYGELKIADDTFVYIRGLPFVSEVLDTRIAIALLAGEPDVAQQTLGWARRSLTDIELDDDEVILAAWITGDWSPRESALRLDLERSARHGRTGDGYTNMSLATVRAQTADSFPSARQQIESVRVEENDFPWLEDIRILAIYGVAKRFGEVALERSSGSAFLERQPLLFEPHHVYRFGLLDVQEPLRTVYQSLRLKDGP